MNTLAFPLRAKAMAEVFKNAPTTDTLRTIAIDIHKETADLITKRRIATNRAFKSLLLEQDTKWQAFARLCPEVSPMAFRKTMAALHPNAAEYAWGKL